MTWESPLSRAALRRVTRIDHATGRLDVLEEARQHYDADRRIEGDTLWEAARAHYDWTFSACPGYAEAAEAREKAAMREERRRRGEP